MFREGGWMSPQLGKLGTRHRGHFPGRSAFPQATGGGSGTYARSPDWCLWQTLTGCIFCQGEHGGRLCLFMQTQTGQTSLLAYSFSLLAAGTLNSKASSSITEYRRIPVPQLLYASHPRPSPKS